MRRSTQFLFFIASWLVFAACTNRVDKETLTKSIIDTLAREKGNYAVAFRDLQSGEEILINEHRMFHAASTMKTPVMIEVMKQAAAGKFKMSDLVRIDTTFKSIVDSTLYSLSSSGDSESELYALVGTEQPYSDLVRRMIVRSSNLATNILIDKVGAKNVTQTMRDMGANDIQVLRGVEDGKAYRAGLNNRTSAYDLMVIFSAIGKGEAIDSMSSKEMETVLLQQEFNDIIPLYLPKEVRVAHKTGWITALNHDSALIILPDGRRYVLVLLSDELENEEKAKHNMATVSKMIYDFVH